MNGAGGNQGAEPAAAPVWGAAAPVRGLIFDFDGLMVDTESATYHSWRELYADHGQPLAVEEWVQCVGSDFGGFDPFDELERRVGRSLPWDELEPARVERARQLDALMDARPGVRERLAEAVGMGLPCAVASSSPRSWVRPWLERLGVAEYFVHVCTKDDVARVKPAPDLFLLAATRLGVEPLHALVFEDSLNGLRAAAAAGMRCIAVPGPITAGLDFAAAVARLDTLADHRLERLLALAGADPAAQRGGSRG